MSGSPFDDLPDGVVVTDNAGRIVDVNAAAGKLLGVAKSDLVGHQAPEVLPLTQRGGEDWWHCADPFHGLRTRSGHPEKRVTVASGPAAGTGLLVTARYVREGDTLVRFVLSLRSARARDRDERRQSELVSAAAHELRSPLAGVRGFSRTLMTKWDRFEDEDRRRMIEIIDSAMDRVTRLVDEMLDVSRLDLGTLSMQREFVDVADLARRVAGDRVAAGEDGDRFVVEAPDGLPLQWVDRTRFAQVLENLLDNALRHGAGQVTVTVDVADAPPPEVRLGVAADSFLIVSVSDEGEGVPPDQAAHIFERFWHRDRGGGTGLGLYLVRGIAQAHHGAVDVFDAPEGGARFVVCVPSEGPPEPPTGG